MSKRQPIDPLPTIVEQLHYIMRTHRLTPGPDAVIQEAGACIATFQAVISNGNLARGAKTWDDEDEQTLDRVQWLAIREIGRLFAMATHADVFSVSVGRSPEHPITIAVPDPETSKPIEYEF